jgi:hypothetical protein
MHAIHGGWWQGVYGWGVLLINDKKGVSDRSDAAQGEGHGQHQGLLDHRNIPLK